MCVSVNRTIATCLQKSQSQPSTIYKIYILSTYLEGGQVLDVDYTLDARM